MGWEKNEENDGCKGTKHSFKCRQSLYFLETESVTQSRWECAIGEDVGGR